jgi:hypothetical protein
MNLAQKTVSLLRRPGRAAHFERNVAVCRLTVARRQGIGIRTNRPVSASDVWVLPLEPDRPGGERKPRPFAATKFIEQFAAFSPDGHWLAHTSNESGREEVYVQAYPGPGAKFQMSIEGGSRPVWSRDGRQLFYRIDNKIMGVDIELKPVFHAGNPKLRFEGKYRPAGHDYDVSPDGRRAVMIRDHEPKAAPTEIRVVQNWFEELKRRK